MFNLRLFLDLQKILADGNDVDLGAQWIHGRNTSIFSFAQSNGILGEELLIEDIEAFYNDEVLAEEYLTTLVTILLCHQTRYFQRL